MPFKVRRLRLLPSGALDFLQDVEIAVNEPTIKPVRVVLLLEAVRDEIGKDSAARRAAHDAVAAVPGVDEQSLSGAAADERTVVRRHRVLASLEKPVPVASVPDGLPERRDPGD